MTGLSRVSDICGMSRITFQPPLEQVKPVVTSITRVVCMVTLHMIVWSGINVWVI